MSADLPQRCLAAPGWGHSSSAQRPRTGHSSPHRALVPSPGAHPLNGHVSPGEPVSGSHMGSEAAVFLTILKIRVAFKLLSSWPKCRWSVQRVNRMRCQVASCRCQLQTASKGHQAGRTVTRCVRRLCRGPSPPASSGRSLSKHAFGSWGVCLVFSPLMVSRS